MDLGLGFRDFKADARSYILLKKFIKMGRNTYRQQNYTLNRGSGNEGHRYVNILIVQSQEYVCLKKV